MAKKSKKVKKNKKIKAKDIFSAILDGALEAIEEIDNEKKEKKIKAKLEIIEKELYKGKTIIIVDKDGKSGMML
jgi:hypothetical protein